MSKVFAEYYERDPEHPNWIIFDQDTSWRKDLFGPEVIQHPAKMQLHIVRAAVQHFAEPGWIILDPFAGTGTTALAATMGYETWLIELEQHFMDLLMPIRAKWVENKTISGIDQMVILKGDCRTVLKALDESWVDMIITSPPYSVTAQVGKEVTKFTGVLAERKAQMRQYGSSEASVNNIGRLSPFLFNRAMNDVYAACARVLKPGGLYVSVTKDRMLAGQRQMLSMDIIRSATESGLEYTGQWWKWKAPGGLMQNLMKSKGAEVVLDEDIICFRKPLK